MATKQIKLTTTGTLSPVVFNDLGARSFTHPTTDYDLIQEYSLDELLASIDLKNALTNGYITLRDNDNVNVTTGVEDVTCFNVKDNLSGTSAPAVTNDKTQGYSFGSRWRNANTDEMYVCIDNTTGNAVWILPLSFGKITIKDEGTNITNTPHTGLNFVGEGVRVADAGSGVATVTVARKQEMHKVTVGEVSAGYFTLSSNPNDVATVLIWAVGGTIQINKQVVGSTGVTPDFDVLSTNRIHINNNGGASGLSGNIKKNDVLVIFYSI